MKTLIEFFTENYKPYAVNPMLCLPKSFILKNGYSENDIQVLIYSKKIKTSDEKYYKLTNSFIKKWAGSSYKYIPEFARQQ